jgi:hypothetical protein
VVLLLLAKLLAASITLVAKRVSKWTLSSPLLLPRWRQLLLVTRPPLWLLPERSTRASHTKYCNDRASSWLRPTYGFLRVAAVALLYTSIFGYDPLFATAVTDSSDPGRHPLLQGDRLVPRSLRHTRLSNQPPHALVFLLHARRASNDKHLAVM